MRKFAWVSSLLFILMATFSVMLASPALPVNAIGEVTPTAVPDEEEVEEVEIDVDAYLNDGLTAIQSGDFIEAVTLMDELIDVEDSVALAFVLRGFALTQLSDYGASIDDYTAAIELEPWQFDYFVFRGDSYVLDGELEDALADYSEAIAINPWIADNYLRRSNTHYELGNDDAGEVDELIGRAVNNLGFGETNAAFDFLDEAIEIDDELDNVAQAYYIRGALSLQEGDIDDAFDDHTSAIEIGEMHNAYLSRGIISAEDGDIEAAGEDFYARMMTYGEETIEEEMEIGDTIEVQMAWRRVIAIEFEGEEGDEVTITARELTPGSSDPLIALVDPDGNPIAGDDDFGGFLDSEIADFELPEDGTYILYLSHAEGGYEFGFNGLIEVGIDD